MERNQFINLVAEIAARVYDERINGKLFSEDPQPVKVEEKPQAKAEPKYRRAYIPRVNDVELHNIGKRYNQGVGAMKEICEAIGARVYQSADKKQSCISKEDAVLLVKIMEKRINRNA